MKLKSLFIAGLLALIPAAARADYVHWVIWSGDETRYAYFLRSPLGETGYTNIWMFVRNSRTGALLAKYVVRNAAAFIDNPPVHDEDEDLLKTRELAFRDALIRKGYKQGKTLPFDIVATKNRTVGGETLAFETARVSFTGETYEIAPDFSPAVSPRNALLKARLRPVGGWRVASQIPIPPIVVFAGTPDARAYRIPPTHPTNIQISPSGKWLASGWQGKGTLPDGYSWPATLFYTPVSALPR